MAKAWVIKVQRERHSCEEAAVEFYAAAFDQSTDALVAVSRLVDDESTVLERPILDDEFARMNLRPGDVKRYA